MYGERNPCIVRKRTTTSFSTWLIRCPMWMSAFANGGPSCRIHFGACARAVRIFSYSRVSSQFLTRAGSFCTSLASIGNGVCGRLSVSLYAAPGFFGLSAGLSVDVGDGDVWDGVVIVRPSVERLAI